MTDYDDYENNLAFEPVGDWADKGEVAITNRTQSSLDLVDRIEELTKENKKLDKIIEYCIQLQEDKTKDYGFLLLKYTKLKELLKECREYIISECYDDSRLYNRQEKIITKVDEALK